MINQMAVGQTAVSQFAVGQVAALPEQEFPVEQGFTTEDILWAIGIWSVILCMSPLIVFYVLMVA